MAVRVADRISVHEFHATWCHTMVETLQSLGAPGSRSEVPSSRRPRFPAWPGGKRGSSECAPEFFPGLTPFHCRVYNQRKLGKPQILCFGFHLITQLHGFS